MTSPSLNSFQSKSTLNVGGRSLTYYSLQAEALKKLGVDKLPYSIKVLLQNLLRHEDGAKVTASDIEALAKWAQTPGKGPRYSRSADLRGCVWYSLEALEEFLERRSVRS